MPLAADIADLISTLKEDKTVTGPTETDLAGARAYHEHNTARFTPPQHRAAVAAIDQVIIPGPGGALTARIYRPHSTGDTDALPTVVWFHGGGWSIGSLETGDILARALCAALPAVVVSVDYRLAPEHPWPAAIDDATATLQWAADHVSELGNDPGRLAVGGDSAGGNMAASLAHSSRDSGIRLAAQILVYPVVDLDLSDPSRYSSQIEYATGYVFTLDALHWSVDNYLCAGGDPADPRLSPVHDPNPGGLPPTVLALAEFDPLRDQGARYADTLREAGVPITVHQGAGLVHGYADMIGISGTARAELYRFLDSVRCVLE